MPTKTMQIAILVNIGTGLVIIVALLVVLHYVGDIKQLFDALAPLVVPGTVSG